MTEPHTPQLPDVTLLDRYMAGELAPDARAEIETWLGSDPAHRRRLEALQSLGTPRPLVPDAELSLDRAWARVVWAQRPHDSLSVLSWESRRGFRRAARRGVLYAVAGATLALVAATGWRLVVPRLKSHGPTAASTYVTGNGQRANITLPDGSMVALGVASRLTVPADYLAGHQTVQLSGEALFTVAHHDGAPFTVRAGGTTTSVLGTSFMVRHYASDTTTVVAVRDGKVVVHAAAVQSVVLTAARMLEVGRGGSVRVQQADPARFGFATGVLTLDGASLRDAIVELDRWYDADIRLGDSTLATHRITGGFMAGSLADLAAAMEWTFQMHVERDGRVLTLFPR